MLPEEIELDIHDLEPPEPFELATSALASLQPGQFLKLVSPRRPRLLYPWLEKFGYSEVTHQLSEELFHIVIWPRGDVESEARLALKYSWFPRSKS